MTVCFCALLSSCYDAYPVDESLWVADMKTFSAQYEDNKITLRGETKMDGHLYFILSQSENFEDGWTSREEAHGNYDDTQKWATINKWKYVGTWFYKLVAMNGDEIYDVSNVESFTVENPLTMLDPVEVTWKQATLRATTTENPVPSNSKNPRNSYFYVTGNDYYKEIKVDNSYSKADNVWEFNYTVTDLDPSQEYAVIFAQNLDGNIIKSEPITFTTLPRTTTPLRIGEIFGQQPNLAGQYEMITDPLSILVYDYKEGYVTNSPLMAIYDPSVGYKWADGNGYDLLDGHDYGVAIFKAAGTQWYPDGSSWGQIRYNESYAVGKQQDPIYYGESYKLSIDNPEISVNLNVKTAQIAVKYPSIWGETSFTLIDDNKRLPSYAYTVDGLSMAGPAFYTDTYSGVNNPSVSDANYKEYVMNIWPIEYSAGKLKIRISNALETVTLPLPIDLSTRASKRYVFEFEGLSINGVYVNNWFVEENGDTIVIKPQQ